MSLSRIEADKGRAPDHKIDLRHLVERTVGERHQPVTMILDDSPCFVMGDEAQLSQLLHNLVDNAFKYGKPDGEVTVALAPIDRDECCLRVSDKGIGISAEHLPRLTERFYRVDTARSQSAGGTGLGLSIVKHIAERHLARLEFSSEIGKGTTVSVTFPVAAGASVT
jgi:two-component system, OmpR family, phosphate regulon sensor histidine kinase PhoR